MKLLLSLWMALDANVAAPTIPEVLTMRIESDETSLPVSQDTTKDPTVVATKFPFLLINE